MAYKKENIKLGRSAYITILVILACILTTVLLLLPSEKERLYNKYKSNTEFTKDHVFDTVSYSEFKSKIKKESYTYVYFATDSDATSVTNISIVNNLAEKNDISKVLYLDQDELSKKEMKKVLVMLQGLYGMEDEYEEVEDIAFPDLWVFSDGVLLNSFQKYKVSSLASEHSWTDEQIMDKQIFNYKK